MSSNALAKIDFSQEQLQVIESQFFPAGASKAEQTYCFNVAKELGLNPITKEIHFVPRRSKVGDKWVNKTEPMVGRDGFLSIAHRSGQLAGIESSCSIKEVPQLENGAWVVRPELVAECVIYRKDSNKKYIGQVNYSEYCQKTAEGKPTKFWAEKPDTMLKKVAESQVLRKAFNIHGVYCPEEMGAGFEAENGEIITPVLEAEFTRIEDKSHLSIVKPPQAERQVIHPGQDVSPLVSSPPPAAPPPVQPVIQPVSPPPIIDNDEDGWPDLPEPAQGKVIDAVALEVIALLDGKHISYDIIIEGINGIISAKSYDEKELLKSSGFRWSPDTKRWLYKFQNEPF
jgi:phage recombination protein Bet